MNFNCTSCEGAGSYSRNVGVAVPPKRYKCTSCNGVGSFEPVDVEKIMGLILATRGPNKGRLRASMTSPVYTDGVDAQRAYYVWRLARFHGGIDTRLPVMAGMVVHGDPFRDDLDKLADEVAKEFLGSNMRAAARWHRAFYG